MSQLVPGKLFKLFLKDLEEAMKEDLWVVVGLQ